MGIGLAGFRVVLCMSICICMCIYIYTHTYIYIYIYIYLKHRKPFQAVRGFGGYLNYSEETKKISKASSLYRLEAFTGSKPLQAPSLYRLEAFRSSKPLKAQTPNHPKAVMCEESVAGKFCHLKFCNLRKL